MNVLTQERKQDAESLALHLSADGLTEELLVALKQGDLSALALFAPKVNDYSMPIVNKEEFRISLRIPQRHQTVTEVVLNQMAGTPDNATMLGLLVKLAYTAEDRSVLAHQARELLRNVAHDFGDVHALVTS